MKALSGTYAIAEAYCEVDNRMGVAVIENVTTPAVRLLSWTDLKEELDDHEGRIIRDVEREIAQFPWLDRNCGLPAKPDMTIDDKTLFADVMAYLRCHVELPDENHYAVCASWVIATYLREQFDIAPRIIFHAPTRSGKTRALETLRAISYRGMIFVDPTGPSLFRVIQQYWPTIFIDEGQYLIGKNEQAISQTFKGGFGAGIKIPRVRDDGSIDCFEPFCFLAFASKRLPPEDWQNRAILISMQERTKDGLRHRIDYQAAKQLRGRLLALRLRVLAEIIDLVPYQEMAMTASTVPIAGRNGRLGYLNDRSGDIARCLLVPGFLFGGSSEVLTAVVDSQSLAAEELRETLEAKVFLALEEAMGTSGIIDERTCASMRLSEVFTRDIQMRLNEDLRNHGDARPRDISTKTVTSMLRSLGFETQRGKKNMSFLVGGEKFIRAWNVAHSRYVACGSGGA